MKNINIRKTYYYLRHRFFTTNNGVVLVALFIAASWAIGSVGAMERNYRLQREVFDKQQQVRLLQLEADTLRYQQSYYNSDEYKELAVRSDLGLVQPGEHALILPNNSKHARTEDDAKTNKTTRQTVAPSNLQQWTNFLFGGNQRNLQENG